MCKKRCARRGYLFRDSQGFFLHYAVSVSSWELACLNFRLINRDIDWTTSSSFRYLPSLRINARVSRRREIPAGGKSFFVPSILFRLIHISFLIIRESRMFRRAAIFLQRSRELLPFRLVDPLIHFMRPHPSAKRARDCIIALAILFSLFSCLLLIVG